MNRDTMRFSRPEPRKYLRKKRQSFGEALSNSTVWQFRLFIFAGLTAALGGTSAVAGLVLVPMMALAGSVVGVVGASAMLAVGAVLVLGVYLWLTTPMG